MEGPSVRRLVVRLLADERVRYVVVGGFNTVIGYSLYAIFFELVFGHPLSRVVGVYIASVLCVYASYVVAVPLAFALHRRFTFRVHGTGRIIVDFPRFCIVYVISLTINTFALPAIERLDIPPLLAQAIVLAGVTVVTYFGHRIFSFHRPARPDEVDPSEQPAQSAAASE
jgi:putative flippase GtrA